MLQGKTALVTGSTSGIGLGIARTFAREGANVILNGFGGASEIETLRASMAAEHDIRVTYDSGDPSKQDQIEAMMATALGEFGAIDILVNNAGIQFVVQIEEVAAFASFLASDAAASITGAVLPIEGGWTAH